MRSMTTSKVPRTFPQKRPISTFVFWSVIATKCKIKIKLTLSNVRECDEKPIPNQKILHFDFFAVHSDSVDVDWWNVYKSKLLEKCEFIT